MKTYRTNDITDLNIFVSPVIADFLLTIKLDFFLYNVVYSFKYFPELWALRRSLANFYVYLQANV